METSYYVLEKIRYRNINYSENYPIKVKLLCSDDDDDDKTYVLMLKKVNELKALIDLFNSVEEINLKKLFCTFKFEKLKTEITGSDDIRG